MIVKVCGLRVPEQIRELDGQVDLLGFNFYASSSRYCKDSLVYSAKSKRTGVFVNATLDEIRERAYAENLQIIQLHGDESPKLCSQLAAEFEIIKVFRIKEKIDNPLIDRYKPYVTYVLFDTYCDNYGGSGKQFKWSILNEYKGKVPFLLSGGIGPESIEDLKKIKHPLLAGVDINSRFESEPGIKNIEQIIKFKNELLRL